MSNMQKENPPPTIRIGIIGSESAGRTSVVNALLGHQYGSVGPQKTTGGIREYRVLPLEIPTTPVRPAGTLLETFSSKILLKAKAAGSQQDCKPKHPASTIHDDVAREDEDLRNKPAGEALLASIHVDARGLQMVTTDTELTGLDIVLLDVPGFSGASKQHRPHDYVAEHQNSIDLFFVVIDSHALLHDGPSASGSAAEVAGSGSGLRDNAAQSQLDNNAVLNFCNTKLKHRMQDMILICNKADNKEIQQKVKTKVAQLDEPFQAFKAVLLLSARNALAWRIPLSLSCGVEGGGAVFAASLQHLEEATLNVFQPEMLQTSLSDWENYTLSEKQAAVTSIFRESLTPEKRKQMEEHSGISKLLELLEQLVGSGQQRQILKKQIERRMALCMKEGKASLQKLHQFYVDSVFLLGTNYAVDYSSEFIRLLQTYRTKSGPIFSSKDVSAENVRDLVAIFKDGCLFLQHVCGVNNLRFNELRDQTENELTLLLKEYLELFRQNLAESIAAGYTRKKNEQWGGYVFLDLNVPPSFLGGDLKAWEVMCELIDLALTDMTLTANSGERHWRLVTWWRTNVLSSLYSIARRPSVARLPASATDDEVNSEYANVEYLAKPVSAFKKFMVLSQTDAIANSGSSCGKEPQSFKRQRTE
eukprot:g6952.t1